VVNKDETADMRQPFLRAATSAVLPGTHTMQYATCDRDLGWPWSRVGVAIRQSVNGQFICL